MGVQILRRAFTTAEYHQMIQAGILGEDDRVELLDGEIVEMAPIASRHAACVNRLCQLFSERVERRAIVSVQNPVRLGERSEPQPDIALLRPEVDFYTQAHPGPTDILLLVEVTETSADLDRDVKVPLYARTGISEVWVVDLSGECVEVYRRPAAQGYQEIQRSWGGNRLAPQAFPSLELTVDEIFG